MIRQMTHKQVLEYRMQVTKGEICSLLNLSPDAYESMRYELATSWLKFQDFFETTARLYMLSKTFYNWWYQRLHALDCQFVKNYPKSCNSNFLRSKYMEEAISIEQRPSRIVIEAIRKEAASVLERNPHLKTSKVYE